MNDTKQPTDTQSMSASPTWPYVLAFALEMERQLAANRHKGDREGWVHDEPHDLLAQVNRNARELGAALFDRDAGSDRGADILRRAVNVANFAMMTADAAGVLQEPDHAEQHDVMSGALQPEETGVLVIDSEDGERGS